MSLVRAAARLSAIRALKGQIFAGVDVLDSEIGAINIKADGTLEVGSEKRFVAVYTQEGFAQIDGLEPRALHTGGVCEFVFEMGITAAMLVRDPETDKKQVMEGVPGTDGAFEFYLDLLGRQVMDALTDPDNTWADIWRALCPAIVKVERLRTDSAERIRLAGHQIKITATVVDDPLRGTSPPEGGAFARFLEALEAEADEDARAQASLIRSALGLDAGNGLDNRDRALGLTVAEGVSLGKRKVSGPDGDPAETANLTVEVDGRPAQEVE